VVGIYNAVLARNLMKPTEVLAEARRGLGGFGTFREETSIFGWKLLSVPEICWPGGTGIAPRW
jgi:hypothetical protein